MSWTPAGPPFSILLKGYYGFGNLGDDLLLLSLHRHLRKDFPLSFLQIEIPGSGDYVSDLLGASVPQYRPGDPALFDAVVLGGGGVFFDFRGGPLWRAASNRVVRAAGLRRYASAVRLLRRASGRHRLNGLRWFAAGVGVGEFRRGSEKFLRKAETLGTLNWAYVRDQCSAKRLQELRPDLATPQFADPVYSLLGVPPTDTISVNGPAWDVCFILRDWQWGFPLYSKTWVTVGSELIRSGVSVGLISFDPDADRRMVDTWRNLGEVLTWNPSSPDSLPTIWSHLARSRIVVTSRAHGLILATMAGVPTLTVEIDPKLTDLRSTLPDFAESAEPEAAVSHSVERILQRIAEPAAGSEEIYREAELQSRSARAGLNALSRALREIQEIHDRT